VWSCAFSPDGTILASTGSDGTIRLWDLAASRKTTVIEGQPDWFRGCTFGPTGTRLATTGDDGVLRIWDTTSGRCVCALRTARPLAATAWHPNGRLIAANGTGGIYLLAYTTDQG
jgi:WD40 repeat protein